MEPQLSKPPCNYPLDVAILKHKFLHTFLHILDHTQKGSGTIEINCLRQWSGLLSSQLQAKAF